MPLLPSILVSAAHDQDLDGREDLPHGGIANSITDPVKFNLTDPQRVAVETMQAGGAQ